MSVKIDKYVSIIDKSGLIGWIRDESNERVIIKINMDTKENTKKMLDMCLDALNTGEFEPVEDDTPIDTVSPAETDGNDGAVEPTGDNDITGDSDNSANNEDLNNG